MAYDGIGIAGIIASGKSLRHHDGCHFRLFVCVFICMMISKESITSCVIYSSTQGLSGTRNGILGLKWCLSNHVSVQRSLIGSTIDND